MIIKGLQKLTLLDYPGKCAATIFTAGCNLRCPFCHNKELVLGGDSPVIPTDQVLDFLKSRKGLLDGVAITGGEPLLQPDLEDFIRSVKDMGFLVKLDTNGCYPKRLKALIDGGLVDYVAMDVKNTFKKYPLTVGVADFSTDVVRESINLLLEGRVDYEFRTTVTKELFTLSDFCELASLVPGVKRWFLQYYKPSDGVLAGPFSTPEEAEMDSYSKALQKTAFHVGLRG